MSQIFTLVEAPHDAFGTLATLKIAGQPLRRFTRQESAVVSRALDAVARGASQERAIYMSPIASDCDFFARVEKNGIAVCCDDHDGAWLDWSQTRELARMLASFGAAS